MKLARTAFLATGLGFSAVVVGADFDGTQSLTCTPKLTQDCKPDKGCSKFVRDPSEKNKPYAIQIDFANKTVSTPYRTIPLPIQNSATNDEQLIIQGTDMKYAWTGIINRTTGAATITVAARVGAFVSFAQCKVATN
jgi:hypothetical protein